MCDREFEASIAPNHVYCSATCNHRMKDLRRSMGTADSLTSTSSRGFLGEIRVCLDLVAKGHEVYKNFLPNGPDLMVMIHGKPYIVEVTTGHKSKKMGLKNRNWNILAVCDEQGNVSYTPDLPTVHEIPESTTPLCQC